MPLLIFFVLFCPLSSTYYYYRFTLGPIHTGSLLTERITIDGELPHR